MIDTDPTIDTIIKENPYFSNAKRLYQFDELKAKIEKIIADKAPSQFDLFLETIKI